MAFTSILSVILIAIVFVYIIPIVSGQSQRVILYNEINREGNFTTIPVRYVPDLYLLGFVGGVRSVCVTGIWIFYEDTDYNRMGHRGVEYVFGRNYYCTNIKTIPGKVLSLRFAGSGQNYTVDSLTLYRYDHFQGEEEFALVDQPEVDVKNQQSIIITGDSHWTIFNRPNYQGKSICLRVPKPGSFTPAFIADTELVQPKPIPHGSIQSIKKGCIDAANNVILQSFD